MLSDATRPSQKYSGDILGTSTTKWLLSNAAGTGKFRADPAGAITLDIDGI